ncbi:MFS transporter [Catenulispora sp. GP43]|uniref:MFS transporter n=1 Tax=Catenulispora sp. GP43 TaxID=3156263 RepID=UPI0035170C04
MPDYPWRLVGLLAITQTVGYGVLFYSFSVFLAPTATALHTSTTTVTGAMTASLLAAAVAAVPVGRWLDRHGGRALMALGSSAATLLAVFWSRVESVAELYIVWIALGVVCAGVLYEAAFPVVVSWFDAAHRARALLSVTVVAGFASTIFLPLAGWLNQTYGWRDAIAVLALGHGVLTIPLHLLVRRPPARAATSADPAPPRAEIIRHATHDPVFWLLGAAFIAQTCAVSAISVLLVSMLRSLGHSPGFAATTAGLLGVLSVTGRLATTAAGRRWTIGAVTAAAFAVQAAGALLLPVIGGTTVGAIGCVLAFGIGFGVSTIARPALLAERYGTTAFATLAAAWGAPLTFAKAVAPLGAVALWHVAGLATALDAAAACCLLGAVGLAVGDQLTRTQARARARARAQRPAETSA